MSTRTGIGLLLAAAAAVAALALGLEHRSQSEASALPSVDNGGPRGLLAARRYLEAREAAPAALEQDFRGRAAEAGVLVLAAPTTRTLDEVEVEAALEVARRGGALVVAVPADGRLADRQPALADALGARTVPLEGRPEALEVEGRDPSSLARVVSPDALTGRALHLAGELHRGVSMADADTVAVAAGTPVILRRTLGDGTVWLLASPSFLENHRLDLADNPDLLEGLAALGRRHGGVLFDEVHHRPAPAEPLGGPFLSALLALGLQLGLVGLVYVLAAAPRAGPVRPLVTDRRRSSLEYVESLAALYRRAASEAELCAEARRDLRRRLFERHGISAALDDREVAERLEARAGVPARDYLSTIAALEAEPADLPAALQAVAALEGRLEGGKLA